VLSDALLLHRHSGRIRMALADILSAQGNFDRALAYIDEALSCPYANSGYQFERANLLRRMGRNDDAISSINHAIRLDPNLPEYFALKADLLESKSEDPTSARMNAVKLAPFIPKYRNSLVSSLQSRNATRLLTAKRDAEMVQYHAEISATLR
jgi:tetratricopeptide (TPR) repeat protein